MITTIWIWRAPGRGDGRRTELASERVLRGEVRVQDPVECHVGERVPLRLRLLHVEQDRQTSERSRERLRGRSRERSRERSQERSRFSRDANRPV